MFIVIP